MYTSALIVTPFYKGFVIYFNFYSKLAVIQLLQKFLSSVFHAVDVGYCSGKVCYRQMLVTVTLKNVNRTCTRNSTGALFSRNVIVTPCFIALQKCQLKDYINQAAVLLLYSL